MTMRHLPTTFIALSVLAPAATAWAASRSGEDIYTASCASCHGSDGRGVPAAQTGLAIHPRDFTECKRAATEPDRDWESVIANGGPARAFHRVMPAFGEVLTEDERHAALVYVRGFCPDEGWPRGDLNFPRPLVTEKAFIEDEVVVSSAAAARSPHDVENVIVYEQRFLRRQMFEIRVPFSVIRDDNGTRQAGIGDVAFALKSALVASYQYQSILSVGLETAFPTGNQDKGLGTGVVVFEPFLAYGQGLPWDSFLQAQVGAGLPTKDAAGAENEVFAAGVLGTSFLAGGGYGRAFSPMIEAFAARELTSGAPTTLDLIPELQVSVSRRQHILACLGVRIPTLNRQDRVTQIMAYVLWDWFDGGLLEGW
jgi:mono/diheme cytochrome c family protein